MNMRKIIMASTLMLVFLGIAAFAFSPVQASNPGPGAALQVTSMPGDPVITGIPNTGGAATDPAGLSWVIWAILGISVLALLIALATRGSARTDL